jgi:ATP-dependent Clp endopeptidase proteolytic subunit ClpP
MAEAKDTTASPTAGAGAAAAAVVPVRRRTPRSARPAAALAAAPHTFRSLLDIALPIGAPPDNLHEQRAWAELRKLQLETERAILELDALRRQERDRAADPRAANVYTFYSGVDAESVQQCMAELGTWSRREPGCDITVIFNSPGGSVLDGLALFDYLRQLRALGHQVTTMALGRAASMGAVLLQAGTKRVIGQNAFLLIHEVSHLSSGRVSELEDSVEFTKRLQKRLLAILAERSSLTERDIQRRWARKEWWVDAAEAVELGLADELL